LRESVDQLEIIERFDQIRLVEQSKHFNLDFMQFLLVIPVPDKQLFTISKSSRQYMLS
jgi:hypothetical protein